MRVIRTDRAPAPVAGAPYSQAIAAGPGETVWVSGQVPVDPNSAYRYSAWVRLSNNNTGVLYFGPRDAVAAVTTGTPDGQPYFVNALARATLVPLRWYLQQ